jgi:YgiT-type zinc finger domain-containing protein
MKCAICQNGSTTEGFTTLVLERGQTIVVFKNVPAQICSNCGEEYVSSAVNRDLLSRSQKEWEEGILLEVLNFAA